MKTSSNGKSLIKQREGVRLTAYTDGVGFRNLVISN